jgi:hypothetical protein
MFLSFEMIKDWDELLQRYARTVARESITGERISRWLDYCLSLPRPEEVGPVTDGDGNVIFPLVGGDQSFVKHPESAVRSPLTALDEDDGGNSFEVHLSRPPRPPKVITVEDIDVEGMIKSAKEFIEASLDRDLEPYEAMALDEQIRGFVRSNVREEVMDAWLDQFILDLT